MPPGPSIDAQSGSADAIPYACHGRPQWKLPPKYSNVIQCMWPSTSPPTRPYGSAPFDGVPAAFRSASGNVAQPVAGAKRTPVTAAPLPGVNVKVSPVSSTFQSAAGLGEAATPAEDT